jgi:hypothetical protein
VEPLYEVERRLMIAALKNQGDVSGLARRYARALMGAHYRPRQKQALRIWAYLLALPIPRLRAYLVHAKRSPVNRPGIANRLILMLLKVKRGTPARLAVGA